VRATSVAADHAPTALLLGLQLKQPLVPLSSSSSSKWHWQLPVSPLDQQQAVVATGTATARVVSSAALASVPRQQHQLGWQPHQGASGSV
jgi:hypothetical protein